MRGSPRREAVVLAAALLLRLVPILTADRMTADVLRYHKVAEKVLEGNLDPYELPRLHPYPPVWVWFEAGSEWLARRIPVGFPVLVKLPVLGADLLIVALLGRWGAGGHRAAWLYALHPVSILVTGFHGQFDSIMLLFVLLALRWREGGRSDASALALAAAIGLKSFPVLLLPLLVARDGGCREKARYVALSVGPVALLLVPFAVHDPAALRRELFGYGGVADFGWIGLLRGLRWLGTGVLARSEGQHWGLFVRVAKALFLAGYAGLVWGFRRGRLRWRLTEAGLAVFLAFLVLYGALSAQYLLWVVPLAVLAPDRHLAAYTVAATAALTGFYAFLQPAILQGDPPLVAYPPEVAGRLWVAGVGMLLAASVVWLVALLRCGAGRPAEAPGT